MAQFQFSDGKLSLFDYHVPDLLEPKRKPEEQTI